jgi:hypothetical protein
LLKSGVVDHGTRKFSLNRHAAVNKGPAFHFKITAIAMTQESDFYAELIAGNDGPPEAAAVNARKVNPFVFRVGMSIEKQRSADLRHRFDKERARHDRMTRKMPLKKRFAERDVFYPDHKGFAVGFQNAVNQQKRIPMRQNLLNIPDTITFHRLFNS